MIHVFHAKQSLGLALASIIGPSEAIAIAQENPAEYSHVANVKAFQLVEAKELTTHVQQNWWDNVGVESDESIGLTCNARSTGPGDVLVKGSNAYVVTKDGFEELKGDSASYYIAS
jgi:hypothetical protein